MLSGVAAHEAGPAVVLSFLLAAVGCSFAALAYAELAAALPVTGSAYAYVYASLGELVAWVVGWNLLLEYALGASLVASGWSGYLVGVLGALGVPMPRLPIDVFAALIVVVTAAIVALGTQESARVTKLMVALKLLAVVAVIGIGATRVNPANFDPFVPEGWGSVLRAAATVFLAFVGFDVVSSTAAEVRNPERDVPRGILGSLAVCTVLYAGMAGVLTGMVPYTQIDVKSPITGAFNAVHLPFVGAIISGGALIGMASVLLALLVGLPRILLAMARDGLLPQEAGAVNAQGIPLKITLVASTVIAVSAAVLPLEALADMCGAGTLTAFTAVCAAVPVLRRREPGLARPFRFPGPTWLPWVGALVCFGLFLQLLPGIWLPLLVWMALGQAVYWAYGYRHSQL